jgi:hypothetical protein
MKQTAAAILFLICTLGAKAQSDSSSGTASLKISGFADVFFAFDAHRPSIGPRQSFLYNHNRHNEFNINLAFVKLELKNEKYRANLALQTGTYAQDNYEAEPGLLKNIFEASAGIALNKKNDLWLDAGVFPSHIGFESARSIDNLTLSRSLLAENSPYYLSGVKLGYQPGAKWNFNLLLTNGWQRIQRVQGNSLLSLGTQVHFTGTNASFNWSSFIGTDDPDSTRRMRYFNNFYTKFKLSEGLELTAGFDHGIQQKQKNINSYHSWISPVMILHYNFNIHLAGALRAEYYSDRNGVIIPTGTENGFKVMGYSFNLDYKPVKNVYLRTESRWLSSRDPIFQYRNENKHLNFTWLTSIAVAF